MKKIAVLFAVSVMIAAASCGGNSGSVSSAAGQGEAIAVSAGETIVGEWSIACVSCGDSLELLPAQLLPGENLYIVFRADDTFSAMAGCNSISGTYASRGGSIGFGEVMMTEMACENMQVEDALRVLLPEMVYCEFAEGGDEAVLKTSDGGSSIRLSRIKPIPEEVTPAGL